MVVYHPINMEPEGGCLEDHFPLQRTGGKGLEGAGAQLVINRGSNPRVLRETHQNLPYGGSTNRSSSYVWGTGVGWGVGSWGGAFMGRNFLAHNAFEFGGGGRVGGGAT